MRSLAGHFSKVYTMSYSKRNSVLYSGGRDRFILEWDSSLMISAARAAKVNNEIIIIFISKRRGNGEDFLA